MNLDQTVFELVESIRQLDRSLKAFDAIFLKPILSDAKLIQPRLIRANGNVWVVTFLRNVLTIRTLLGNFLKFVQAVDKPAKVIQVLAQFAPLFALYAQYAESKGPFLQVLHNERIQNAALDSFIKNCENCSTWPTGLSLEQLVQLPLEQLSNYRGIAIRMKQLCSKNSDIEGVVYALEHVQRKLNELSSTFAETSILKQIMQEWDTGDFVVTTQGRRVLKTGKLKKKSRRANIEYTFVLFNDVLIYGAPGALGGISRAGIGKIKMHRALELSHMSIGALSDDALSGQLQSAPTDATTLGPALLASLASLSSTQKESLNFGIVMEGEKSFAVEASDAYELCNWWFVVSKAVEAARAANPNVSASTTKAYSAPIWQQDSTASACTECSRPFTLTRRRTHCRLDGRIYCKTCCSNRIKVSIPGKAQQQVVKVCNACFEQYVSDQQKNEEDETMSVEDGPTSNIVVQEPPQIPSKRPQRASVRAVKDSRERVVQEILQTEETYLTGMRTMQQVYIEPLLQDFRFPDRNKGGEIVEQVSAGDLSSMLVFLSDVGHIITLSEGLLQNLQERFAKWTNDSCVGDLFLQMSPLFQLYDEYSGCFDFATRTIDQFEGNHARFKTFLRQQGEANEERLKKAGAQSLKSLLILPIQRLPRYILLLQECLKKTPESHPDKATIAEAIELVRSMTTHINEKIRERSGLVRMYEVRTAWGFPSIPSSDPLHKYQEDATFLFEGKLIKQSRSSFDEYQFLLLSEVLLYGAIDVLTGRIRHHRTLELEYCRVQEPTEGSVVSMPRTSRRPSILRGTSGAIEENQVDNSLALDILGREKSIRVFAKSQATKQEWLEKIQTAILDIRARRRGRSTSSESQSSAASTDPRAPLWEKNGPRCSICNAEFTIFNRRHHCRRCGRLVDQACSPETAMVRHIDDQRPVRICVVCTSETLDKSPTPRLKHQDSTINPLHLQSVTEPPVKKEGSDEVIAKSATPSTIAPRPPPVVPRRNIPAPPLSAVAAKTIQQHGSDNIDLGDTDTTCEKRMHSPKCSQGSGDVEESKDHDSGSPKRGSVAEQIAFWNNVARAKQS